VGHASYDLVFVVPVHPQADEKIFADDFIGCGGGPAANASVTVAHMGYRAAFAGYLGHDIYGRLHSAELERAGVSTLLLAAGASPTPISAVLVKPDGKRALVNYKGDTRPLPAGALNFSLVAPKTVLFDGHQPNLSAELLPIGVPTVLDAGSVHEGTLQLMFAVDYLVCSEKFASQWLGNEDPVAALGRLAEQSPAVAITLGERGLLWRRGGEQGQMPAFPVDAVDTTGAGDAFHGAFAAAIAARLDWLEALRWGSAAGALCCTGLGARPAIPHKVQVEDLLRRWSTVP
jgi:sulfofructose kinase